MADNDQYVYFLYSEKQEKDRITIESTINKLFVPGKVLVRGKYEEFTEMTTKPNNTYNDTKIIAEGIKSTMKFKPVLSKNKR